jgi:membrane peptidoglycan carboxypeptidase
VALLAAIPQSPTDFDLVKNAVPECSTDVAEGQECPKANLRLVVPAESAVVIRRNKILELMQTRSVLSGANHTLADYQAAKSEEVVLTPQGSKPWKAAHFVWQVRSALGAILCGEENADVCEKVDTGGYRIVTTLDWTMQQVVDKWLLAAARSPNLSNPERSLKSLGIPESEWDWLLKLKDRNIHNAAAAVLDYRTGQILAYAGSAGYYATGDVTFQPQFDVLSDGQGRQPGSAIKPLNYITGLDDGTMTAATMFMDVTTDFGGQKPFTPTQADRLERGPVRLRSALQFSLNIPSIKAGLINGLDHLFQRFKDFGLTFPKGTVPVTSMSIGTLEVHPIDMASAYGAIANGGVLMPRVSILKVTDAGGDVIYPTEESAPLGKRVASAQASYIITDILQGNTITKVNPYWSKWRIVLEDGKRRPAAYKTGTTSDNKDVLAFGYLAPPEDPAAPALVAGVWMGNSDATPNTGSLSLDSSAPLWSRILTEISMGMPSASFAPPGGLVTATVDAFSGLLPGPYTVKKVDELFIDGTVPTRTDDLHVELDIDQATGLLWQDGCTGPMVRQGFLDFSNVEPRFPAWQQFTQEWAARAAMGPGRGGGPDEKPTKTSYFYNNSFAPFGRTWGGTFAPTAVCAPVQPPICDPGTIFNPFATPDPFATFDPLATPGPTPCIQPVVTPAPEPTPDPGGGGGGPPTPIPDPTPGPTPKK